MKQFLTEEKIPCPLEYKRGNKRKILKFNKE